MDICSEDNTSSGAIFLRESVNFQEDFLITMHQDAGSDELDKDMLIYEKQQNSYSIRHQLVTVTTMQWNGQWQCSHCWQYPAAELINCVITMLPAVYNTDYTVTVQSPYSHCAK